MLIFCSAIHRIFAFDYLLSQRRRNYPILQLRKLRLRKGKKVFKIKKDGIKVWTQG